ncbi:3-dehydroquinate synthase II family protein [Gordonia desulfuricans]|uniref:3-dehydroquinate synthase II family protein n=1 Tax=Gordonia desulfuricans TaxID=89051 RepID=A0A7K3LX63_9ACTN|nr:MULTISPECIES: 3-dehydroquinate synthase II [Gordonia]EMP12438.1 3-dehydroquinate synthase [Gordonia sp. NB41Y]NDK92531.1 3-dehydroquinate synthase II family protein [Gordonia desulfuricans]WLP90946.1 3-dehydroquinate synthase II [Gordonia sp. NB41Y]
MAPSTPTTIVTDHIVPEADAGNRVRTAGHFGWVDVRGLTGPVRDAVIAAALNQGLDGIVADDPAVLSDLPPTIRRILAADHGDLDDALLLSEATDPETTAPNPAAVHVIVSDAPTLTRACDLVRVTPWTVLTFTDPTKIPLEIVIAAAENSGGKTITVVNDIEDAEIVKLVLEHGSDGLLLAPRHADDVVALAQILTPSADRVELSHLTVTTVEHIGMGERACIDTCSLLELDEGCLIGSFASGMFLSCSETHPLPYMPTRPFRWNAGAVHSYVMTPDNRTRYVSELRAGQPILAVRSDGTAREVRIGRVKIERRPLISITATSPDGKTINVIAQDDWHVRLLGPGGSVNNVTELKAGDVLLGYVPTEARHVGLPITEFCDER